MEHEMPEPRTSDLSVKVYANEDRAQFELTNGTTITLIREEIELLTTAFSLLYNVGWTKRDLVKETNFQLDYASMQEMRRKYGKGGDD